MSALADAHPALPNPSLTNFCFYAAMFRSMYRLLAAPSLAVLSCSATAQDAGPCDLCFEGQTRQEEMPLRIEIVSGIDFSRMALVGEQDGSAQLDPQTGRKDTDRGLIDLGGMAFQGRAKVSGEPLRQVRIELPEQVTLYSPLGGKVELSDFVTDIPEIAALDAMGRLEFRFGARLQTIGAMGGTFRGRIPIRIDYN